MDNKKKIILASSAAVSLGALGVGVLAFFNDEATKVVDSTVGTMDVTGSANITHTQVKPQYAHYVDRSHDVDAEFGLTEYANLDSVDQLKELFETAPNNLNPGDNDEEDRYISQRPGTDHEINITVKNTGNKSVITRAFVEITGKKADGTAFTTAELANSIKIAFDPYNTLPGISAIQGREDTYDKLHLLSRVETENDTNKLTYGIDAEFLQLMQPRIEDVSDIILSAQTTPNIIKSGLILSGVGTNAEIEKYHWEDAIHDAPTEGSFKLDLIVDKDVTNFENATITMKVTIQGMQYRNTADSTWDDLFTEEFNFYQ